MIRKTISSMIMAMVLMISLHSQVSTDTIPAIHKNTVKLNVAAMVMNNISMLYERQLNDHWSVQMGAGYRWGGNIPKVIGLGEVVITSGNPGIRGFTLTPEVRYYFDFCGCGANQTGFYAGLYGRWTTYDGDLRFNFWNGTDYIDVGGAVDFREAGIGIQLGYQFVIKKRFVVDLMFAGPRTSRDKLKFSVKSEYAGELAPLIEDEINKRLAWFGMDPISIDPTLEGEVKFRVTMFRYALGIGYRF